ncbi:MAG: type III polyketide synthase [Pirellulaceae bacterium]
MAFSLLGLATALPEHSMSAEQAIGMSNDCVCRTDRHTRLLRTVFRRTGISNRQLCVPHEIAYQWVPVPPRDLPPHESDLSRGPTTGERMALYAEHAAPLALRAVGSALESSAVPAAAITHLITVSCTGFEAPGVDVELIDRLQMRNTVERVHVGFMGCHGAINGMRVALGLTAADPAARVLLCATELCSLHFCFSWDQERILGNALFADGAAAFVCGNVERRVNGRAVGGEEDGRKQEDGDPWSVVATGSCLAPESREAITWRIGDFGYEMSLSNRVPELIKEHLRPWLASWLERRNLSIDEIGSWAIHPGGPRIVDAVQEGLGLSPQATQVSRSVLEDYGNMSSPTVLFILERLRRQAAKLPCVLLGFGPGLVAEAALIC